MKERLTVDVNSINPVDYYNRNCVQHTLDLLLEMNCVEQTGIKSISYVKNKSDKTKRMVIIDRDRGTFIAEMENGFGMAIGEPYTAFMMLQRFIFKNNWMQALSYVVHEMMKNDSDYIRVGFKYFKKIFKTDRYGITRTELKLWDKITIFDDHGKDFINGIEKFEDFDLVPDNKNHKPVVGGCYNLYAPFEHTPCQKEDYSGKLQWYWIETLIKHIFGSKKTDFDKGIRYLKVLYDHPKQALPILVLISQERGTGKTTFVNFLNILFGANTVIINPQDIGNSFNSGYADKNIIMIEESHFESRQALEKIKNLSTQKTISVNQKFVAQYSIPFFGKLIITSNDEQKFSKVDDEEIRYWVRKIPVLSKKNANHKILESMTNEIPYFLRYLEELPDVDLSKSRMVFTPEEISTEELKLVKLESRAELHKELDMYLDNHAQNYPHVKEFYFIAINIKDKFFSHNHRFNASYINRVLKNDLKLAKSDKTMRFIPLETGNLGEEKQIGKPYIYSNKYYDESSLSYEDTAPEIDF